MITVHHESAQTNSWKFYELADEVEKFSYKALDALEPKAEGGFWANLWSGAARYGRRLSCFQPVTQARLFCFQPLPVDPGGESY